MLTGNLHMNSRSVALAETWYMKGEMIKDTNRLYKWFQENSAHQVAQQEHLCTNFPWHPSSFLAEDGHILRNERPLQLKHNLFNFFILYQQAFWYNSLEIAAEQLPQIRSSVTANFKTSIKMSTRTLYLEDVRAQLPIFTKLFLKRFSTFKYHPMYLFQ